MVNVVCTTMKGLLFLQRIGFIVLNVDFLTLCSKAITGRSIQASRSFRMRRKSRIICYQIADVIATFLFCNAQCVCPCSSKAASVSRPHSTRQSAKAIRQSYAYHQLRSCTAVSFLIIHPTTESYTERKKKKERVCWNMERV